MATILVTGSAGFIGFHVAQRLVSEGHRVVGVDNLSPYFFPSLKAERERRLRKLDGFISVRADITDLAALTRVFDEYQPEYVVNLAAQAGVRFSIKNPQLYEKTNIAGFLNVLESCRRFRVSRLVYAS